MKSRQIRNGARINQSILLNPSKASSENMLMTFLNSILCWWLLNDRRNSILSLWFSEDLLIRGLLIWIDQC